MKIKKMQVAGLALTGFSLPEFLYCPATRIGG